MNSVVVNRMLSLLVRPQRLGLYQRVTVVSRTIRPAAWKVFALSCMVFFCVLFQGCTESKSNTRSPVRGENWMSPATGMKFVWVEQMGLWVGKYEATNAEYRMKEPNHDSGHYKSHSLNGDRQPVVFVNFDDARSYAEWLTQSDKKTLGRRHVYRLPSNDEWMTFAQCGDFRQYPWGNEWPPQSGQAGNYHGTEGIGPWGKIQNYSDGFPVTAPVDELWKNPWGLHGVGGNVWELCAADTAGQLFGSWRGGSWSRGDPFNLLCRVRASTHGSIRGSFGGFRLVMDARKQKGRGVRYRFSPTERIDRFVRSDIP